MRNAGYDMELIDKRDSDERRGFYHRLFAGVGKRSGRAFRHPRRLRGRDQLRDIADAKHALLHSPDGRALMRDVPGASIDELAQHLLEASSAVTNKRNHNSNEASNMSDHLVEVCKSVVSGDVALPSEAELTQEIRKLANAQRKPGETSAAAFTRIYTEQSDDGLVLRKAIQLCKRANGFPV
jgi:hypothetical protein